MFTVPGCELGDLVWLNIPMLADHGEMLVSGTVSAPGQVMLRFYWDGNANIDFAPFGLTVVIIPKELIAPLIELGVK